MFWLLGQAKQKKVREQVSKLTLVLSSITDNPQDDQIFPYVGRKDRRKAREVIKGLCSSQGLVVEPFAGSGSIVYAAAEANRKFLANEWEPYACRMANAPWKLPGKRELEKALAELKSKIEPGCKLLYKTVCSCGYSHILDSLFFDRKPLRYTRITKHERLGHNGENITYRGNYACPRCGKTEKHFSKSDKDLLRKLDKKRVSSIYRYRLIENSRINLNKDFLIYGNLFPQRSKLALDLLWNSINSLKCNKYTKLFLQDAFLSILPQAKFKDYRSKSQDLHCPEIQLREVNIFYRFEEQVKRREERLRQFSFSRESASSGNVPIKCEDFRDFMSHIKSNSVDLVLTDPPWLDGNAYFEKAQLYHPWLNYSLLKDKRRLDREFVVTDAPTRKEKHNIERWWQDMERFYIESARLLRGDSFLALYFRPIPARNWLTNLNRLKLLARKNGFEPLLSIDVGSSDPSMRIQQSAAYVFSQDIVFLFLKIPPNLTRLYKGDIDVDSIVFRTAENMQEKMCGPFSYKEWRKSIASELDACGLGNMNRQSKEELLLFLFKRYVDEVSPGKFLPKLGTPFSGQLFDTPAVERIFTYVPQIIDDLTSKEKIFSYDKFLITLSTYVENGTRALISQIEKLDIKKVISPYAEPLEGGRYFKKRTVAVLSKPIKNIMALGPYEFEKFIAQLLTGMGFTNVALVGRAGDMGVDLVANDENGKRTIVQCKRYIDHKVSATPIQRLHSFAVTRGAMRSILITTSDFTLQAKAEARHTSTELINGEQLRILVAKYMREMAK